MVALIYARLGSVFQSAHTTTAQSVGSSSFVAFRSRHSGQRTQGEASRVATHCQLHPHRRCHTAQAHSNAAQSEQCFNVSPPLWASCALDTVVRSARSHCAHIACAQAAHATPKKCSYSTATATLRGRAKIFVQTGRELLHGPAVRYTKHTRKRSSSSSTSTSTGSSCSRAHPHSGLGLGRADDDEPIKKFLDYAVETIIIKIVFVVVIVFW